MPRPAIPRRAERNAGRYLVPVLALAHLLCLLAWRRSGGWDPWAPRWAGSAFAVFAYLLVRDLVARRRDLFPDIPSALAWGAAGALEIHALSGAVAASRVVPALTFPAIAYLLPSLPAAGYAAVSAAWLSWSPGHGWPSLVEGVTTLALAGPGLWAGAAVRRGLGGSRAGRDMMRKAIEDSRSFLLPWEAGGADSFPGGLDDLGLIRWREETADGIRRVLEGLLPMTGADVILFVTPPATPGRPFLDTVSAQGRDRAFGERVVVPDSYVPVREATVFRRAFSATGEEAGAFGVAIGGRIAAPTGVAAAPVAGAEKTEGAVLALRFGDGGLAEPAVAALEMGAYFVAREIAAGRRTYRSALYIAKQDAFPKLVRKIAEVSEAGAAPGAETVSPRREIYRETALQTLSRLDADYVLIIEADERGGKGRLALRATRGGEATETDEWVAFGDSYAGWVVGHGTSRIFTGVRSGPGRHPVLPRQWIEPDADAYLLVPVKGANGFGGLVACLSREGRSFQARDAEAAGEIARIMRMGLSHAVRVESLERDATRDGLTGLLNQKTFRERLANVVGRLDGRYPCAVIMLDLDHFKRVNDTHGHPAGDEVLKKCASVIRKTIRKVDFAGRYGGEEFVIYLAHTDRDHAVQVAERLRRMIRQTKFVFGGKDVGVTASLGIACSPEQGRTGDEMLKRADEALYRSKEGGRDRVTAY